jgi:hypothetical protein
MNTTAHSVAPEMVMAFLDGELSINNAKAVSAHLDACQECSALAEQFRATSKSLSRWTVAEARFKLEDFVNDGAAKPAPKAKPAKPGRYILVNFWNWRLWAIGGGGALAAILILAVVIFSISSYERRVDSRPMAAMMHDESADASHYASTRAEGGLNPAPPPPSPSAVAGISGMDSLAAPTPPAPGQRDSVKGGAPPETTAPMIARTVSLTVVVKDFAAARASLDNILARHRGYAAQLTVSTPENAPRTFQASLRVPAPELAAAIDDLRALGRVENESQSGEEVGQQHADLVQRLKTARDTEERFRAILQQRTGKLEDVLQVEEEIARVRGEIEGMEAEQKALEHRVDFATVELQLSEMFSAQLGTPSNSVSNQMHNAFVNGLHNAFASLLGIVLFFVEYGPALLIWLAILGAPIFFIWRRYRRMRAKV